MEEESSHPNMENSTSTNIEKQNLIRVPTQEAVEVCKYLALGSSCRINTHNGLVDGNCRIIRNTQACVPK
jgi:hypothetical protein